MIPVEYAVLREQGTTSYGTPVPDFAGCVAAKETKEEAGLLIRGTISLYSEALPNDERPIARSKRPRTRIVEVVGSKPVQTVRCIAYRNPIFTRYPRQTDISPPTLTTLSRVTNTKPTRQCNGLKTRVTNDTPTLPSSANASNSA